MKGGTFDEGHFEDTVCARNCSPRHNNLDFCLDPQLIRLGIWYPRNGLWYPRLDNATVYQHYQRHNHSRVCFSRQSRGTSNAGSVDDWADAEIPLLRAGCDLRITQLPTNLVESKKDEYGFGCTRPFT